MAVIDRRLYHAPCDPTVLFTLSSLARLLAFALDTAYPQRTNVLIRLTLG